MKMKKLPTSPSTESTNTFYYVTGLLVGVITAVGGLILHPPFLSRSDTLMVAVVVGVLVPTIIRILVGHPDKNSE